MRNFFLLVVTFIQSNNVTAQLLQFTYDNSGRLTNVNYNNSKTSSYSYDNDGNRVTVANATIGMCINLRAYLEGSLINNSNALASDGRPLMRDNLRNSPFTGLNYIPVKDIYEFATPYVNVTSKYTKVAPQDVSHPQYQQVTDSATVFGVSGQNAIVDWVFVELRTKSNSSTVAATRAALLQRDGDVVEVDGQSCLSFPGVAVDSYYVAVRHRTHMGTMTKYAQSSNNCRPLLTSRYRPHRFTTKAQ